MDFSKRADANSTVEPPKPLVVEPSGVFDGNDGKWSTFYINIGDSDGEGQGRNFKVLVSTSSPITMVPGQSEWCDEDCAKKRGIQVFNGEQPRGYNKEDSSTWTDADVYTVPKPHWWNRGELNGSLGTDNVGMGETSKESIILAKQLVMTYTFKDYYLGFFGLAAGTVSTGSSETPPFLYNLAQGAYEIPSVSYGHTAGASYRKYILSYHLRLCDPLKSTGTRHSLSQFWGTTSWSAKSSRRGLSTYHLKLDSRNVLLSRRIL